MQLWEGIYLAMTWIRAEKLKSFFALLGVIIGVMFLITVVSVVEGMDRYITEDFSSRIFGVNTVTLQRWPEVNINTDAEEWRARLRRPQISYRDVEALQEGITVPVRIAVENTGGGEVGADNGNAASNVSLVGASPEIFQIRDWTLAAGRPFSDQEAERGLPVVVLGSETAGVLFQSLDPLGREVRIRGFPYRVIGVLEEQGSLFGQSLDGMAVAPDRSRIREVTNPSGFLDQVVLQALDPDQVRALQEEVVEIMRIRRQLHPREDNDFAVETADEALSFWDEISQVLFLALPGLVAIALVVGGIVIMNIMLVSVMERTREIGLRKALGARQRDILTQVLIESATLSGVGALIGVGIGIGLASVVAAVSPLPAAIAPRWIALGMTLGISVGVAAGVYPASRAAKLDPVDALRYE